MEQQLIDFYAHLNEAVIITNDFAEGTRYRKREKVAQFAYYRLNPVYLYRLIMHVAFHGGGRSKPQYFFEVIQQEMTIQLKADPAFTDTLTKNPFHERWIVESFSGRNCWEFATTSAQSG